MKPLFYKTVAALALTATSALADGHAKAESGLYGFAFGGTVLDADLDYSGVIAGNPNTVDNNFDDGYQVGVGVGKYFDAWSTKNTRVRGEIELSFADSDADEIFFSGNGPAAETNVGGSVRTTALFANAIVDFKTQGAFTPFIGGGLGIGHVDQDLIYGPGLTISDSDTVLAAQGIVGVAYQASDRITLTADARYRRFFNVGSARLNPAGASTGTVSGDFASTSLNVGMRLAF